MAKAKPVEVTVTAKRSFFWEGENVNPGDVLTMSRNNAAWMMRREAVVAGEDKPKRGRPAKADK